jgi:hypothetical protein
MRKTQKTTVVVGGTIAAVLVGGVAFAYWTTSGGGSGSATTSAGNSAAVHVAGDVAGDLYPGDAPKSFTATVTNTDANQKVYVSGVTAYLTVTQSSEGAELGTCDETDYSLDGDGAGGAPASTTADVNNPVALTFSPVELGKAGSTTPSDHSTATGTIQFNNKATANQDGCKGATVALNYASN